MSPTMPARSNYERDPRVDAYIARLPQWQQEICTELRDLINRVDPAMTETIKRSVQPYFVLNGNVCALLAAKDHINLFLYDGGIVPDPAGIITAGHSNKTARTISYRHGERINARPLAAMLKQISPTTAQAAGANSRSPSRQAASPRRVSAAARDDPRRPPPLKPLPFRSGRCALAIRVRHRSRDSVRIPDDLPEVAVGIAEVAGVDPPWSIVRCCDGGAGGLGFLQ